MKNAGLNPMLAYQQGGAKTGPGAQATSGIAAAGIGGAGGGGAGGTHLMNQTEIDFKKALTEKTRAEAESIKHDSQTKPVAREKLNEEIREVVARIDQIKQDTSTSSYSASNLYAATQNLLEVEKLTKELIQQAKAHTGLANTQIGKTTAEHGEIAQRAAHNLPEAERLIKDIEAKLLQLQTPAAERSSAVYDTKVLGELAALLKAFAGVLPNIGIIMRPSRK